MGGGPILIGKEPNKKEQESQYLKVEQLLIKPNFLLFTRI